MPPVSFVGKWQCSLVCMHASLAARLLPRGGICWLAPQLRAAGMSAHPQLCFLAAAGGVIPVLVPPTTVPSTLPSTNLPEATLPPATLPETVIPTVTPIPPVRSLSVNFTIPAHLEPITVPPTSLAETAEAPSASLGAATILDTIGGLITSTAPSLAPQTQASVQFCS